MIPDLPHKGHSSDPDVHEMKMDHSFANRRTDSELMTVLNFLHRESGSTFAFAVHKGPGDFPVSVTSQGLEVCGRKRLVLRTDSGHAVSALSTAVCQASAEENHL